MFEMDESEHTADPRRREPFGDTAEFIRYNYADIMQNGSEELQRAAEIVLSGSLPAIYKHVDTA